MAPILYSGGREVISIAVPSLEHIAAVKITAMLWKQINVETLMQNLCLGTWNVKASHISKEEKRQWVTREQEIREKVSKLPLPELLKTKILGFVKPIGMEMVKWKYFHVVRCNMNINFPNEFCWTPHGRIDRRKTAELMIKDSDLSTIDRYYLACLYCLETSVVEMWSRMPAELRRFIRYREDQTNTKSLVPLWTHVMKEEMPLLDHEFGRTFNLPPSRYRDGYNSPLHRIFEDALYNGNKAATDYIWPKLTTEEQNITLDRPSIWGLFEIENHVSIFKENHIDIIFFLLSQQSVRKQKEVLELYASMVLLWLLDWSWQDLFLPMANYLQDFSINYKFTLENIVDRILSGHEDYDYLNLLTEFWMQIPVAHQKEVIRGFASDWKLLQQLCIIGKKEKIELILKNATLKEQENIISFYSNSLDILCQGSCCDLLNQDFYTEEVCKELYFFLLELYQKKAKEDSNLSERACKIIESLKTNEEE